MIEIGGIAISSAFFAGLIMFLAPCTFPLVPGYLGFISGVSKEDLENPSTAKRARRKIFINGVMFVLGFTLIFMAFGLFAGLLGSKFASIQQILTKVGGGLVILFGLFMLGILKIPFLSKERKLKMPSFLTIGKPSSSFLIGSSFAVGWTPCVGPLLAGILLLASQSATAYSGALLLFVFSLGLAIPFLIIAAAFGSATKYIQKIDKYLKYVSYVGGVFLILLGTLLIFGQFDLLLQFAYENFDFFDEILINYL